MKHALVSLHTTRSDANAGSKVTSCSALIVFGFPERRAWTKHRRIPAGKTERSRLRGRFPRLLRASWWFAMRVC